MNTKNMATTPIKKLILTSSIPVMLSMALQAFYNIVDSIFLSNMATNSEEALNALTLAYPIQMLMIALCIGTGLGISVLISRCLGQQNIDKAKLLTGNATFLCFAMSLLIMLFGFFGVSAYISSQTTNPIILEMGVQYLSICTIFSFGTMFFGIHEKLLQSTGRSLYSTIAQISGALTNIILDPILIYGLFGLPELGVMGAGYATVIGQVVAFIVAFSFHRKLNKHIIGSIKDIKPQGAIIKEIYIIGFPAILAQALISFMAYGLNVIFVLADEIIVTVYGLYYKIQQFVLMIIFGLRDATMPILSFAFGAKNKQRLHESIKFLLSFTIIIMLVSTLCFELFANPIASAFNLTESSSALFVLAIRIISASFIFAGFNISCQAVFQSVDRGGFSLIISFARQIVFVLPFAYLFTMLAISDAGLSFTVWFTFIIAETITAIISMIFLKQTYKKKINTLMLNESQA